MTPGTPGALRLREKPDTTPRARRMAVVAILLTLAAATGDCAGRAADPARVPSEEVGP